MMLRLFATTVATATLLSGAALAQDTPPGEVQALSSAPAAPAPTGPEWWAFSRATTRHYLIDIHSIQRTGDELTVSVARVPTDTAAGDYSHTVDQFGIQCRTRQSHVVMSSDAMQDGVTGDAFATDEPWESIARDSFDDAIREISCDDMRPQPPSYPSVKAYIDAGRP